MQRIRDGLTTHRSQLIDILECQYGLLDELIAQDVLNQRQAGRLQSMNSDPWKQNEELIDLLLDEAIKPDLLDELDFVIFALNDNNQSHVANLLMDHNKGKLIIFSI